MKNYRAVLAQSEILKLFDCLVTEMLSWHHCRALTNLEQHGFTQGKPVATNLVLLLVDIIEERLHSAYIDFCKGFDRVNFNIFLNKMKTMGTDGPFLSWLDGRTQAVKCKNFTSRTIKVS